jgi:hypothetical protein
MIADGILLNQAAVICAGQRIASPWLLLWLHWLPAVSSSLLTLQPVSAPAAVGAAAAAACSQGTHVAAITQQSCAGAGNTVEQQPTTAMPFMPQKHPATPPAPIAAVAVSVLPLLQQVLLPTCAISSGEGVTASMMPPPSVGHIMP